MEIEVVAPINIALIKYWGKRDTKLIIPLNDSISVTINELVARTHVTVSSKDKIPQDNLTVNDQSIDIVQNPRFAACLTEIRSVLKKSPRFLAKNFPDFILSDNWHCSVASKTNFPVSAGLASSSAGFSALVYALGSLFDFSLDIICRISRLGSGSACRSTYGGFVHWISGSLRSGSDCSCSQIAPSSHWPSLRCLIVVSSCSPKLESSTRGMQLSVETSDLLTYRVQHSVPLRIKAMREAILCKNFPVLADLIMRESNQFHAVCLDTFPPLFYLEETSKQIIRLVHAYNSVSKAVKVAYTFDAGANACLFMEEETVGEFLPCLRYFFPNKEEFLRGERVEEKKGDFNAGEFEGVEVREGEVLYVVVSKVGAEPYVS